MGFVLRGRATLLIHVVVMDCLAFQFGHKLARICIGFIGRGWLMIFVGQIISGTMDLGRHQLIFQTI